MTARRVEPNALGTAAVVCFLLRVMKTRHLLGLLAGVLCAVVGRAEYTIDDAGRFAVIFPGPIERTAQEVDTALGKIALHLAVFDGGEKACMVIYCDYPPDALAKTDPNKAYEGAINGAVQNSGGTLRSKSDFKLGDIVGRDVIIDVPEKKTVVHVRFFLVQARLHQAMYCGPTDSENGPDATAFLNSFRLLR
jgi:hypothetical protein